MFGGVRKKERVFGEERETKMRGRRNIVGLKTDLTYRYLYLGYSIYLFLLFYIKELYFISYQMNKSNIFFLQTIILIKLFIFIYLIIKKPHHFL